MVIGIRRQTRQASLATECVIAMSILAAVMIPLSFSFLHETRTCRAYYNRAVALEIVDGEMELLAAGEWRAFQPGRQTYPVQAAAARNLPPGEFVLTLENGSALLEWRPQKRGTGGIVSRQIKLR